MKNKKLKDSRISNLSKGKVKGIGFFEGIGLKIRGRIDGARNLPRENNDGSWVRPILKERFAPLMSLLLVCGVTFKLKKRRNMPDLVL